MSGYLAPPDVIPITGPITGPIVAPIIALTVVPSSRYPALATSMERRRALRLLISAATLPVFSGELLAAFHSVHSALPDKPSLKTLNPHQNAAIVAMAELIIPRTDTPGATDVRVNEFIDLILTDWYDQADRVHFLEGLAGVDKHSQSSFGKKFVDCSPDQQAEVLRFLGENMAQDLEAAANGPRSSRGGPLDPRSSFYFTFRRLVLTGYFTSEAGATQQLHYQVIPDHIDACAPLGSQKQAAQN
ncbi:MAG: hypothetical protein NVS9B4_11540 [Candidatus Acidiferrum sp.]